MKRYQIVIVILLFLVLPAASCILFFQEKGEAQGAAEPQNSPVAAKVPFDTAEYNSQGEMQYVHNTYTYKYRGGTTLSELRWEQENDPSYYLEFAIDGTGVIGENGEEYYIEWAELSQDAICIYIPTLTCNHDGTYTQISNRLNFRESDGYIISDTYWSAKCEESVYVRIKLVDSENIAYVRTIGADTGKEYYFYKYDYHLISATGDIALGTEPRE